MVARKGAGRSVRILCGGSEKLHKIVGGHFQIAEDRSKESRTDCFACVRGNGGDPAVWMLHANMAAASSFDFKPGGFESADQLLRSQPGKARHTAMRCTPTSSMGSADSPPSRQSSITSRTRFM